MEILYTIFNMIASLITEVLYDLSLINNLFSFDINKKYVVFNSHKYKIKHKIEDIHIKDIKKEEPDEREENIQDLENNKNIDIYFKENSGEQNTIVRNSIPQARKKVVRKRKKKNASSKVSKSSMIQLKDQNVPKENIQNIENRLSIDENKNIMSIYNAPNEPVASHNDTINSSDKELKSVYINNWLICCFWCSNRKKNVNKVLILEGSKLITDIFDILIIFSQFYVIELLHKKFGIEPKGMNMSDNCKNILQIYKSIEN